MSQWIRIDADIERNRKVLDLRARLGWSPNDCLARLVRLFSAVREQAPTGDLTAWSATQIALAMEPAGGLGEAEALVTALLASDLFLELNGRLLLKGWAERNGDWIRESMTTQQRAVAGRRRAAGALRDASGRYLPSDQPAIGQLSTVTQISPAAVIENSPPR